MTRATILIVAATLSGISALAGAWLSAERCAERMLPIAAVSVQDALSMGTAEGFLMEGVK